MSKFFKIFLVVLWVASILLVIFDPFSIAVVGIVNGVFILIGGLNYVIFRKTRKTSVKRDFFLILLAIISVGMIFYFVSRVNKIILNTKHTEFVIFFNLPKETCIQYQSTITIPESGILFICDRIKVFDHYSSVLINGAVNYDVSFSVEVYNSGVDEKEIGVVYGGLNHDKAVIIKDSLVLLLDLKKITLLL